MTLNEYLMSQRDVSSRSVIDDYTHPVAERIKCKDGFSLSVQAHHGAYCMPRVNIGPWKLVEVVSPSIKPENIMYYAEDYKNPTGTVYAYVPINLVEDLIESHGGMIVE